MDPAGADAKALIEKLVSKHVAVTSTLPVFENLVPGRPPLSKRMMDVLSPPAKEAYLYCSKSEIRHDQEATRPLCFAVTWISKLHSCAPEGFCSPAPIRPATAGPCLASAISAAWSCWWRQDSRQSRRSRSRPRTALSYMGKQESIGSIAPGKNADLVVVKGNPAEKIEDIEQVEIVFKDGVGYDSAKLIESVRGRYGQY